MPIHRGEDKEGAFYQWGRTGKKFHFDPSSPQSKSKALNSAQRQQSAIYASGYKEDSLEGFEMRLIIIKKRK